MKTLFTAPRPQAALFALALACVPLAICRAASPNAWDIAVIDGLLNAAKPGQTVIDGGCFGVTPAQLRAIRDQLAGSRETRAVTPGIVFQWPGGNVYYRFDAGVTAVKMQAFRDGAAEWAAFANLTFVELPSLGTPAQTNYITVKEVPGSGGYSSSVGMKTITAQDPSGEQFIEIGSTSWNRGTICHEIGHALGFFHEHQRTDRDDFVEILTGNIQPGAELNFIKVPAGSPAIGAYDFLSVMHYSRNTLASGAGLDTIQTRPAFSQFQDVMGRVFDRTLSKLDRAGMAAIYGAPPLAPGSVVTNTRDAGPGSLRTALYVALDRSTDLSPQPTTIAFQIPLTDPGYDAVTGTFTIRPTALLVALGNGTTIDGASQAAFLNLDTNPAGPEIVLHGGELPALGIFAPGLRLRTANCTVQDLVIQGFSQQGLEITGAEATGNVIRGCWIGTNATGTAAVPNAGSGLDISAGARDNVIGGSIASARNVISGNQQNGIHLRGAGSDANVVQGNFIGTSAAGTAALPNAASGIEISAGAKFSLIGGTAAGAGNVISGNTRDGLRISGASTASHVAQGNHFGVNAAGTAAVANGQTGVRIFGGSKTNTVGGTSTASRNMIAGNLGEGVAISSAGTDQNLIAGNFVGLNATGAAAIGNGFAGVGLYDGAQANTVGGLTSAHRNVIGGQSYGVALQGAGTSGNFVLGNYIGLRADGTAAAANTFAGVGILGGASANFIGGTAPGARNVISGNAGDGVFIRDAASSGNQILGNTLGWNPAGTAPLANSGSGVSLAGNISSNAIGGTNPGASNLIANNEQYGVVLFGADGPIVRTPILGNSIFNNGFSGLGIFGGANNGQTAPSLTSATFGTAANPGGTDVAGSLSSAADTAYRVEFFASPAGSGFGSGRYFAGAFEVTTDSGGSADFIANPAHLTAAIPAGYVITATATDPLGNTSAFSTNTGVMTTDSDSDGLPNAWEQFHFGHPTDLATAGGDADGDGLSNLNELRAGTDPRNPSNRLILTIERLGADARLTLTTTAGKTYRLEFTNGLSPSDWRLLSDQLPGGGAALQLVDPAALGLPARFYRATLAP